MTTKEQEKISKVLCYILRHKPESIGIKLDKHGWANLDDIIRLTTPSISQAEIEAIVDADEKDRYSLDLDARRVRCNQGHSVKVDLQLIEKIPPVVLYHGTVSKFMDSIIKEGLKPMKRHHVHLSADKETAQKVGNRRGTAVILQINTATLVKAGQKFYISDNGVWLTDHVPPSVITQ